MQRKPADQPQHLSTSTAHLALQLADDTPSALCAAIQADLESLALALQPWGKFRAPVQVQFVADLAALRARLPEPTPLTPQGAAFLTEVVLIAPSDPHDLRRLLRHELGHVQCFQRCTPAHGRLPALPTWFREGLAQRIADGRPDPLTRRALAAHPKLARLPDADDVLIAEDPRAAYALAAHLFTAWHDRFGTLGLTGLQAALRQGHPFASAFQRACQQRYNEFIELWLAALRREARTQ